MMFPPVIAEPEDDSMPRRADRPLIYDVTRRWLEVVASGGGLFRPAASVWTVAAVESLDRRIAGHLDISKSGFQQKLGEQARAEGPAGQRLAAEALFIWQIKDSGGLPTTKRADVDALLAGLTPPVSVPPDLDDAFTVRMANYGPGRLRSAEDYRFVLRLAGEWARLDDLSRARLLAQPWEFRGGGPAARNGQDVAGRGRRPGRGAVRTLQRSGQKHVLAAVERRDDAGEHGPVEHEVRFGDGMLDLGET